MSKRNKKHLSLMVAAALGFSLAFGVAPSDAMAATTNIKSLGSGNYNVDGTTMSGKAMKESLTKALAGSGNTVNVDSGTATYISDGNDTFKLGSGTTLNVAGSASTASVKGGTETSEVNVNGTSVSGKNVNLDSVTTNAKGGKTIKSSLTGTVNTMNVSGDGEIQFKSTDGALSVNNLEVSGTTKMTVEEGSKVEAAQTTLASGVTLDTTEGGTLSTKSLVVEDGANVTKGSKVAADEIVVSSTSDATAAALANLQVTSATEGEAVKLTVTNATEKEAEALKEAVAAKNPESAVAKAEVSAASTVAYDSATGKYKVGSATVDKSGLAAAVNEALKNSDTVTLDKQSTKELQGKALTIPEGKTLTVADGTSSVTATASKDSTVTVNGLNVEGKDAAFSNVTIAAPADKTVTNKISGAAIDNLTVTSGTVKTTEDVTAKNVTINDGAIDTAGKTLKAETVTVNGGQVAEGSSVETNTLTVNEGTVAGTVKTDKLVLGKDASSTSLKGATISANTQDKVTIEGATDAQIESVAKAVLGENAEYISTNTTTNTTVEKNTGSENPDTPPVEDPKETADKALSEAKTADAAVSDKEKEVTEAIDKAVADPFNNPIPAASDVSDLETEVKTAQAKAEAALEPVKTFYGESSDEYKNLVKSIEEYKTKLDTVKSGAAAGEKAALIKVASPAIGAASAATVVNSVLRANISNRTADLRSAAAAVAERTEEKPENIWVQFKHAQADVKGGQFGTSEVKTMNYTLGYDMKISERDFMGIYMGTSNGHVNMDTGRADIDGAFHGGFYGTHMLPNNQYVDYQVGLSSLSSKFKGYSTNVRNGGVMLGYGQNIQSTDNLMVNPFIQFTFDNVSTTTPTGIANPYKVDTQHNFAVKLGVNFDMNSGLYGGLAYSHGLDGSFTTRLNNAQYGTSALTEDNDFNIVYLNLGYRTAIGENANFDFNVQKTFCDYKGWDFTGKFNFFF